MVRVVIDIPSDKMKLFLQSIVKLGIDKCTITYQILPQQPSLAIFKTFATKFLLFDWEFFSNELEYE